MAWFKLCVNDFVHSGPVSHHRGAPSEEYADKSRSRHRSRSRTPVRQQRETKTEISEQRRAGKNLR